MMSRASAPGGALGRPTHPRPPPQAQTVGVYRAYIRCRVLILILVITAYLAAIRLTVPTLDVVTAACVTCPRCYKGYPQFKTRIKSILGIRALGCRALGCRGFTAVDVCWTPPTPQYGTDCGEVLMHCTEHVGYGTVSVSGVHGRYRTLQLQPGLRWVTLCMHYDVCSCAPRLPRMASAADCSSRYMVVACRLRLPTVEWGPGPSYNSPRRLGHPPVGSAYYYSVKTGQQLYTKKSKATRSEKHASHQLTSPYIDDCYIFYQSYCIFI